MLYVSLPNNDLGIGGYTLLKKILIVDDNEELRKALVEIVTAGGYDVSAAENGEIAREMFDFSSPDLILSDLKMPMMNGFELLKYVKAQSNIPVILMTAFGHIIETQVAYNLGADDFFTKPLKGEEILACIEKHLGPPPEEPKVNEEEQYCRIPIQDFVSHEMVRVNVHIRLGSNKYVRVAHKGDVVPTDRVENYKNKGVTFLYAHKEDFAQLVGFNLRVAKRVTPNSRIDFEKRANFIRYTTETILEQINVKGIDAQSYNDAKELMRSYINLIAESENICDMLDALNSHADWVYAHSLGVSVYSIMIAKKMGWTSSLTFFKLGMAALLHDIGLKEVDPQILNKPRISLTHETRHLYETHSVRGREILETLREIPNEIAQIVYEHHESCHGRGYPSKLSKDKIHPLAKIVAVADAFCYEALKSPHSQGCDGTSAVRRLDSSQGYDPMILEALRSHCTV